jgi:hypothetical protein
MCGTNHLGYTELDIIVSKQLLKKYDLEGINWIILARDGDQWWALVNTIMNLGVPLKAENFLTG